MLNLFAATGHNNYAKSVRLYYERAKDLKNGFPHIYHEFMNGNHTVRRTTKNWAGLSTDLFIEQVLMKSLKGKAGVIGQGMSDNLLRTWTKTMHRSAEITEEVEKLAEKSQSNSHQETLPGRVKRDELDLEKLTDFFAEHNPFEVVSQMVCLTSGLVDDNGSVNYDQAEEVGETYSSVVLKRKNKIVNLQSLYSTVKVQDEIVDVGPNRLFLHLMTVVERREDHKIPSYFEYELAPYPCLYSRVVS